MCVSPCVSKGRAAGGPISRRGGSVSAIAAFILCGGLLGVWMAGPWLEAVVGFQSGGPMAALPVADVRADYLAGVIWWMLLAVVVFAWGSLSGLRGPFVTLWVGKGLVVLVLMLFYDFRYGVDPDGYFANASAGGFGWEGFVLGSGTENMRTVAWLHYSTISTSFHVMRVSFALVGLGAIFLSYRAAVLFLGREDRRIFYVLALAPSILFWSSILGKDPITMLGVAAYLYGVVGWHRRGQWRYLLFICGGLAIAMLLRFWLGAILLIPLAVLGWMEAVGASRKALYLALGIAGILLSPLTARLELGVDTLGGEELLGATGALSRSFSEGGSTQEVPELASVNAIARFAPFGMFSVLFRPLPGEILNPFGLLAGLENALLLCLALRAAWRTRLGELREPLVVWALLTVLAWALVYSLGAYQNLGTANRVRLEIMPLLIGVILYLGRRRLNAVAAPDGVVAGPRMRPLMRRTA